MRSPPLPPPDATSPGPGAPLELPEEENLRRLALEAAGIGSWRHSLATGEVRFDALGMAHFGFDRAVITLAELIERIHPDHRAQVIELTRRGLDPGGPGRIGSHQRVLLPSGEERWLDIQVVIVFEGEGARRHPVYAVSTSRDITAVKRADATLREQLDLRERLALVAAASPVMICALRRRPDRTVVMDYASDAVEALFGLRAAEACADFGALVDRIHPDDAAAIRMLLGASRRASGVQEVQFRVRHPQRGLLWLEARWRAVPEGHGAVLWQGSITDVTSQKAAEEALRAGELRFRELVDSLDEIVFSVDLEGRISFVNRAVSRFGYRPEQLIGRHRDELIHPDDLERVQREARRQSAFAHGPLEYRLVDASGGHRAVRSTTRVQLHDGEVVGVSGVMVDLSDQRAVEDQLRAAQKMEAVGRLAGGVAHDFNNLLTVILSYSEMAVESLHAEDPMRSDLAEVVEASRRAQGLTSQLLAFSRRQVLNPEVVDLHQLVTGLGRMLGRLLGEDVRLEIVGQVGRTRARVDRGQIEQVVMNLAVNARDAMPGGGRITIACAAVILDEARAHAADLRAGPYVELSVADSGTGMDEATRARIFEPFFTTKSAGKGTGLGLSTVYGIVKQSGGGVRVESELGRGSTFRVYLPPATDDELQSVHPRSLPARARGGRDETILVVEDDGLLRELVQRVLGAAGYPLLVTGDPEQALHLAAGYDRPIALLFTDVIMPGMNGRQLAERMAVLSPRTRVLFTSGYLDDSLEQVNLDGLDGMGGMGGARFLPKPYDSRDLLAAVREALDAADPLEGDGAAEAGDAARGSTARSSE